MNRAAAALALACLLAAPLSIHAQRIAPAPALGVVDEAAPAPRPLGAFATAGGAPLSILPRAAVAAPDRLAALADWNRSGRQPVRNGFARALPLAPSVDLAALLHTRAGGVLAGGVVADAETGDGASGERVWAAQVRVDGAWRLRLHLAEVALPPGSRLWVYGDPAHPVGPIDLHAASAVHELWTPSVAGGSITLEVHLPRRAAADIGGPIDPGGFRVDRVLELVELDPQGVPVASAKATPACLVDASCIADSRFHGIADVRRAIALLGHVDRSGQFAAECTGALLNDTDDTSTLPYLLTANHCLSTPAEAATLETFFDVKTPSCNGPAPSLDTLPRVIGATLLATSGESDFTFLELARFPDNQRFLLGWEARPEVLANGTPVHQISHPFGRPQSYNEALFESHPRHLCSPADEGGIPIDDLTKFIYLRPTFGGTFVGSSGSPVLLDGGLVVGQLTDGCGPEPANGCDYRNDCANGAFSATFSKIARWLDPRTGGASCVPDEESLCLSGGRFRVRVQWTTADGASGPGHAVPLTTDTGYFWFFAPGNIEVVMKVLNGCGLGSRYWFFAGGLTDVKALITVTDTRTAAVRTYANRQGRAFQPIQDTAAFATCP
jgi:hypothetical protein